MRDRSPHSAPRRLGLRVTACVGAAALAATIGTAATSAGAAGPTLKSANIPNYTGVLENAMSRTLYALSIERGAKIHCKTACLSIWPPLLVKSSVTTITLGKGVKGKIGFVKRSATTKQVTFNSYPVYTYAGDTGPNQSMGEQIVADGGIWRMVHANARTAAATPYLPILNKGTSKGTAATYAGVVQNTASRSLYVLSAENGGSIHCSAGCLSIWPPLMVTSTTTSIAMGQGVAGTVGFITRGTGKQVTINSYPVYTYSGDTGAAQCNGQHIVADGGTWTLINASATTSGTTQVSGTACNGPWGYIGAR